MDTRYVYLRTEPGLWTVGFYDPQGLWHPESDHSSAEDAAKCTAWLNGSGSPGTEYALKAILPLAEAYLRNAPTHPDNAKLEDARAAIANMRGRR